MSSLAILILCLLSAAAGYVAGWLAGDNPPHDE